MLMNLAIGLPMMVVCLIFQTILLVAALRYYVKHRHLVSDDSVLHSWLVISMVMLILVLGNLVQISAWALLFVLLEEFHGFGQAFYHSTVNFSSLGYGDIVMSDTHKLLGALEAINGVLMIGLSTAALMGTFQDILRHGLNKKD
jgi:voltage-gated potassium channel Kch